MISMRMCGVERRPEIRPGRASEHIPGPSHPLCQLFGHTGLTFRLRFWLWLGPRPWLRLWRSLGLGFRFQVQLGLGLGFGLWFRLWFGLWYDAMRCPSVWPWPLVAIFSVAL